MGDQENCCLMEELCLEMEKTPREFKELLALF
jgi:hypothetical protein